MTGDMLEQLERRAGLMTAAEATLAAHRRCDELEEVVRKQGAQLHDLLAVVGLVVLLLAVLAAVFVQRFEKQKQLGA